MFKMGLFAILILHHSEFEAQSQLYVMLLSSGRYSCIHTKSGFGEEHMRGMYTLWLTKLLP